jgi:DNA-binding response OmpR family regulator
MQILIVDDEQDLVDLITYNLVCEGYKVFSVSTSEEALEKIKKNDFDFFILDHMLPGLPGTELCRLIRSDPNTAAVPVIILTARADIEDRIKGLEAGADDYMTKPFNSRELIARMKTVLRRSLNKSLTDDIIVLGDLWIDKKRYIVNKRGIPVHLSAMEFKLLLYLIDRRGKISNRDHLVAVLWKGETFVEPRTVDVHIRRLRARIEDDPALPEYIKTRRGVGYYIDESYG